MVGCDLNKPCPPWSPGLVSHEGHGGRFLTAPLTDIRSLPSVRRTGSNQPEVRGGGQETSQRFPGDGAAGGWGGARHSRGSDWPWPRCSPLRQQWGTHRGIWEEAEWRASVLRGRWSFWSSGSSRRGGGSSSPRPCLGEQCLLHCRANCQLPREAQDGPVPHIASADRASKRDRGPQVGPPPKLSLRLLGRQPSWWILTEERLGSDLHFFRKTALVAVRRWNEGSDQSCEPVKGVESTGLLRDLGGKVARLWVCPDWIERERGVNVGFRMTWR